MFVGHSTSFRIEKELFKLHQGGQIEYYRYGQIVQIFIVYVLY